MTTDEEQAQDVVAIMGIVEALGDLAFRVVEVGNLVLFRQFLLASLPTCPIEGDVAADKDEPGGRIARRSFLRPGLECAQARLLESLLGRVEVAEIAQERGNGARPR